MPISKFVSTSLVECDHSNKYCLKLQQEHLNHKHISCSLYNAYDDMEGFFSYDSFCSEYLDKVRPGLSLGSILTDCCYWFYYAFTASWHLLRNVGCNQGLERVGGWSSKIIGLSVFPLTFLPAHFNTVKDIRARLN